MSLETRLQDLITRLGTEFKTVYALTGDKAALTTTVKTSLVAAINEVKAQAGAAAVINDAAPSTTTTYSSTKTDAQIAAAVAALVNGAPTALDTLKELADKLAADDTALAAILTGLDNRVRVDAAQAFTTGQKAQARSNIDAVGTADLGNTDRNLVADLTAALA